MKEFSCGDVVPGCDAKIQGADEGEVLAGVAAHARDVHGMDTVPDEVVARVKANIRDTA